MRQLGKLVGPKQRLVSLNMSKFYLMSGSHPRKAVTWNRNSGSIPTEVEEPYRLSYRYPRLRVLFTVT